MSKKRSKSGRGDGKRLARAKRAYEQKKLAWAYRRTERMKTGWYPSSVKES